MLGVTCENWRNCSYRYCCLQHRCCVRLLQCCTIWCPSKLATMLNKLQCVQHTGWPLVWKTWKCHLGNLTAVREMSGILLKIREMSGNCQGKNLVREKLPINCLLQAAYSSPYRYLVGVCCVLNVKYMVSVHCTVAFLPPPLTVTLVYE